jgi:hypothetical protein
MNNPPASPVFPETSGGHVAAFQGMTLRDYFAAKAIQAILPTYNNVFDDDTGGDDDPTFPELLAKDAYIMADAMMKARETNA